MAFKSPADVIDQTVAEEALAIAREIVTRRVQEEIAEMEEPPQIWGEVWYEIQKAISQHGSYQNAENIEWSSSNVAELVRLKGWQYLCTTTDPSSVVEAQARQVWEDLRERRIRDRAYEPLQGATLHRLLDRKQIDS